MGGIRTVVSPGVPCEVLPIMDENIWSRRLVPSLGSISHPSTPRFSEDWEAAEEGRDMGSPDERICEVVGT